MFIMSTKAMKKLHIKEPIDIVAHWALCINGRVYELAHSDPYDAYEPYRYQWKTEAAFVRHRYEQGKEIIVGDLGRMARSYADDYIDYIGQYASMFIWPLLRHIS